MTPIKKIKVMLKGAASSFGYEGHGYKPGDIFMIEESKFVPYLMEKIEEPKKKKVAPKSAKPKETNDTVPEDLLLMVTEDEPVEVKEPPKKTRGRKKAEP